MYDCHWISLIIVKLNKGVWHCKIRKDPHLLMYDLLLSGHDIEQAAAVLKLDIADIYARAADTMFAKVVLPLSLSIAFSPSLTC